MVNQSSLFTNFNQARAMARRGVLDIGRVNRALGIAQSKQPIRYGATGTRCRCKDSTDPRRPGVICKHRIAAAMVEA